ncbi:MAG TPA: glycoside hydrolase family 3 N-terminal domain-containing protein, partial [Gaiellaceae bacterium]|nr:glycoside hydrolase family 3 N-terminal domain-containing protein [Gaiellaceae bacterium]
SSDASLDVLRERALPPFAAAIEAGVRVVMTAHIRFGALGEEPATLNPAVIELLRTELGFDGVVMTDALEMQGAGGPAGIERSAVRSLAAGADALCLGADLTPEQVKGVRAAIVSAVQDGALAEERLEAASRVADLAAWTSPRPFHDRAAGAEAARLALRVEGDPAAGEDPLVVELRPEPTIAAGPAGHGLGELLAAETIRLHEGDRLPTLDPGRPLVLVLRDAHRHPWQRELVVPEAVVIETGVPEWRPEARAFVATYGPGRANLAAAAELLAPR